MPIVSIASNVRPKCSRRSVTDFEVLKRLLAALEQEHVQYAIFGAVALNLHGLARFTEHLDLFAAPEAGNIERLKDALRVRLKDRADAEMLKDRFGFTDEESR